MKDYIVTEAQRSLISVLIASYVNTHSLTDMDKTLLGELQTQLELEQ